MNKRRLPPGTLEAWVAYNLNTKEERFFWKDPSKDLHKLDSRLAISRCAVLPVGPNFYRVKLQNIVSRFDGPPINLRGEVHALALNQELNRVVLFRTKLDADAYEYSCAVSDLNMEDSISFLASEAFFRRTTLRVPTTRWELFNTQVLTNSENSFVYHFVTVLRDEELGQVSTSSPDALELVSTASLPLIKDINFKLHYLVPQAVAWIRHPEHRYVV